MRFGFSKSLTITDPNLTNANHKPQTNTNQNKSKMIKTEYNPTSYSPPGETLSDILEERGITQKELSIKLGRSDKNLSQIVNGKAPITPDLAMDLETVLGTPAHFWNNREARYREWLTRQSIAEPTEDDLEWARSFPYPKMASNGWIAAASSAREKFFNLLKFFGVVDRSAFIAWQATLSPMYRRSPASNVAKDNLIAAWLRQGELEAAQVETGPYSEKEFEAAVWEARKLTCDHPADFDPKLRRLFADAGVALLFIPELPSMGVSGATRWLGSKAVIQVTLLYKTNDHFWFTIFHESCHILKHQRRAVFLETPGNNSVEEAEANEFAANLLIPPGALRKFIEDSSFDKPSVVAFAESIGICPGVVVGRLQRERLISYGSPLGALKEKFRWKED